jgi:hypothetical protein
MDIEPYIIEKHVAIINAYMSDSDYDNALEALGRLAEFYLGCMPESTEEKWK